jgi:outer membrane protein TolC
LIVDVAAIGEEQAYYDYMAGVATLVANVERAYWDYVLAIENVRVQERGLELAKELLRQNEGRFKVGALPRTSVLESEAEVARREADLVTARAFQHITRDNLRALVNAKQHDDRALIMIEPADKPTVVAADINLEQSLQTAYTKRPELIAARLNVNGRQVERKIAENRLLPRFRSAGASGSTVRAARTPARRGDCQSSTGRSADVIGTANEQVLGGYKPLARPADRRALLQYTGRSQPFDSDRQRRRQAEYAQSKVNTEGALVAATRRGRRHARDHRKR